MNLVLVILDSLRRDHVGCYGNDWIKTPALDALATESIRFTNAYPESLPTVQARQSIYNRQPAISISRSPEPQGRQRPLAGLAPGTRDRDHHGRDSGPRGLSYRPSD